MTDSVKLEIKSCKDCPNMKSDRHYTADSFENEFIWTCKASQGKLIAYMDWNDKLPPIPKWCPLREIK